MAIAPVEQQVFPPSDENGTKLSPTVQKILKIASIVFLAIGIALIAGGVATFGISAAAGAALVGLSSAIEALALGVFSLYVGCQMLINSLQSKLPKLKAMRVGPFTVGV